MTNTKVRAIALNGVALLLALGTAPRATAQDAATSYPNMAPIGQYLVAD